MASDEEPQLNQRKVRQGLAMISLVVVVAVILAIVVTDPLGRVVMIVVALIAFVRAGLLVRALRRDAST